MSFYNTFATDENLESAEGVKLDYGQDGTIIIHRAGGSNRKFAKVLSAKMQPHRRKMENGTLDDDVAERLLIEAYAESIVIGWKDVKDAEGKKITFNKENCIKLLTDLPELFKDIQNQANTVSNFRKAQQETDVKNSPKS